MIRIPVVDAAQAASWDERARTDHSIPSRVLMEAAGRACAGVIAREFRERLPDGVLVVCGTGNNGGDGWVAGRALRSVGVKVWGVPAGDPRTPDCEANQKLALGEGVELLQTGDTWPAAGLLVDALLGTGASGPLHGAIAELAQRIVDYGGPIAAVDGPTGVDLSSGEKSGSVIADLTVTFGGLRRGHLLARDRCGRVVVVDIGFPPPPRGRVVANFRPRPLGQRAAADVHRVNAQRRAGQGSRNRRCIRNVWRRAAQRAGGIYSRCGPRKARRVRRHGSRRAGLVAGRHDRVIQLGSELGR